MALTDRIATLATRIATEIKTVRASTYSKTEVDAMRPHVGPNPPAAPVEGQLWFRTDS